MNWITCIKCGKTETDGNHNPDSPNPHNFHPPYWQTVEVSRKELEKTWPRAGDSYICTGSTCYEAEKPHTHQYAPIRGTPDARGK